MIMPFQSVRNTNLNVSGTSTEVMATRYGDLRRTQFLITNTSAAAVVTITKGDVTAATSGSGIVLQPLGTYFESSDSGFVCWQGAIQAVSTVAGTIGLTEVFEGMGGSL